MFTIPEFYEWCKEQDARRGYNYLCNPHCALGQFLLSRPGASYVSVGGTEYTFNDKRYSIPWEIRDLLSDEPRTFGALEFRLRTVIRNMEKSQ